MSRARSSSSASGGSPSHRSSNSTGGFFHNVKKAFAKTSDHHTTHALEVAGTPTNPELPGFSHGFTGLKEDTSKLKGMLYNYHTHLAGMLEAGRQIGEIYERLLHSTDPEHVQLADELSAKHAELLNIVSGKAGSHELHSSLTQTESELDQQVEYHNQVAKRMEQRNHLGSEVEYYAKKFEGLQADRQKRAAKGAVEKPEHVEKYDRNQRKLTDVRQEYLDASASMTEELRSMLNLRGQFYARQMLHWSNAERHLGTMLVQINKSTESVSLPDLVKPEAPPLAAGLHSNDDYAPVDSELPAATTTTSTVLTSGATRATNGEELLAKNQIVQPPENASEYNVDHGYGDDGHHIAHVQKSGHAVDANQAAYAATNEGSTEEDTTATASTEHQIGTEISAPYNARSSHDAASHNDSREFTTEAVPIRTEEAPAEEAATGSIASTHVYTAPTQVYTSSTQASKYDTSSLEQQVRDSLGVSEHPAGHATSSSETSSHHTYEPATVAASSSTGGSEATSVPSDNTGEQSQDKSDVVATTAVAPKDANATTTTTTFHEDGTSDTSTHESSSSGLKKVISTILG